MACRVGLIEIGNPEELENLAIKSTRDEISESVDAILSHPQACIMYFRALRLR